MPAIEEARLDQLHRSLLATCLEFSISTPARLAAFLGQLAHESGQLRYFEELWGPTLAQLKYERPRDTDGVPAPMVAAPPLPLWQRLGNTEAGDGYRFRGRGPIQLTGRQNYFVAGRALHLKLEENPDLVAGIQVGFRVAGWFWDSRAANELADRGDFDAITYRINGGMNGKADRDRYHARARFALGLR